MTKVCIFVDELYLYYAATRATAESEKYGFVVDIPEETVREMESVMAKFRELQKQLCRLTPPCDSEQE